MSAARVPSQRPGDRVKRMLDILVAGLGLVCALPLLLVLAALVRWRLGGPVLFTQERGGWRGTTFRLYKFRTMRDLFDPDGDLLPDHERITPLGAWLRRTSLDELPSLWNVVRGDMSLVGPRPLLARYLERYSEEEQRRHDVKPGITGWAQVNGRNAITWEEKFRHDIWYVEHQSLRLDFLILWKTFLLLLRGADVNHNTGTTMPEFFGHTQSNHSQRPQGSSLVGTQRTPL